MESVQKHDQGSRKGHVSEEEQPSFLGSLFKDYLGRPSDLEVFNFINFISIYLLILILIANSNATTWSLLIYPLLIVFGFRMRNSWKEKERRVIAHRIPFFADAIANALAVGCTLEQAFEQSVYYFKGDFKRGFERVMLKHSFGKKIGPMLKILDDKFPRTGLKYLICLLEEYEDLGIGISPLLKKIAEALKIKEEEEEKILTILSGGSSYAKLSIGVFALSFFAFAFLLKEQVHLLIGPKLKPVLIVLVSWAVIGMIFVIRITSIQFSNHLAQRPYVKAFMDKKQWTINELLDYCGIQSYIPIWQQILLYFPLIVGFGFSYLISIYNPNLLNILVGYGLGIVIARFGIEFVLKGLVEDQLIKAVETFPDFLEVFTIGLNSGLNQYKAFEFAEDAIEGTAPELLRKELTRTKSSIICGQNNAKAWQRLLKRLPFEMITDFCELMIISPLHGESIIKSIEQLMTTYQTKKITMVEKTAIKLGQYVIPVIVLSFFPLFLFSVFGPLFVKVMSLFQK